MNKVFKRVKRIMPVLPVILIVAFSLSACATQAATPEVSVEAQPASPASTAAQSVDSEEQMQEPEAAADEEITLSILDIHNSEEIDKYVADLSAEFEKENPGVKVVVTSADSGSIDAKRLTLFSAGQEPDIVYSNAGETLNQYVRQGKIADIENLVDSSLWLPGPLASFESNGHLYGVTQKQNVVGLWYNIGLFEELGLTPPTTFEELLEVSDQLKAAGIIPFGIGNKEQWPVGIIYDYLTYNYCGPNARENATFEIDQASWTDACFVEAAQKTVELVGADVFPTGFNGLSNNDAVGLFFNDQAGFTVNGTWLIGISKNSAPEDFEMAFIAWPNPSDAPYPTNGGEAIIGSIDGWAISASSQHKEIAAAWLNKFGEESHGYNQVAGGLPIIPDDEPENPLLKEIAGLSAKSQYTFPSGDRVVPSIIAQAWLNNLQSLAGGSITPEQFTQAMVDMVQHNSADLQ